ncbi:DUF7507 domain-containing protein [Actinoplanes awajinensis]|uniref:DUF11 domain-containing protein n=1 Tax=Actinoplanes awajinensis subsp. mycoplanecinus TaxID=135947 RepID=A0A101JG54_9ACTN|nr:DUF11 domain-containing protein [Actinoplanes awajinensis]KUL26193.1 hypothetical protein ADL15_38980 [Actinoplanes awajinensis subsp. mycoplanecinus]
MVKRRELRLLLVPLLLLLVGCLVIPAAWPQEPVRAAQTACAAPVLLANGDFEAPAIAANSMSLINEGPDMPGWKTSAPDHVFELWHEVRQGFNAGSGVQFVELNANYVSTLYQDLPTTPGQTLRWELKHRGRLGTDVMAVKIGVPNTTLPQNGGLISDGSAVWGSWSGTYTVPAGQTLTRFAFDSISAAQNKPTYGNFLDGISFGTEACLFSTTTVSAATANVGDLLTYTVSAENRGGNPAKLALLSDVLPAGTTFVPGSIRSITGASSTAVSDSADSDTGEYDASARTVRVRAGTGAGSSAGGTIPVGESRSFSYQVRVNTAAAETTLSTEGTATYTDPLSTNRPTATGNTVVTTVNAAADLRLSAVIAAGGVMAGRAATTNLTVTNAGPSTATGVQVSAVVPPGIVNVTANLTGAACVVTGGLNARCTLPSMASGATAVMVVSGDVLSAATPGAQATLTSAVTSTTYEVNQADNAASVSGAVATLADLGVTMTNTAGVAGATVTYTVPITNTGPSVARSLVLSDAIANSSTYLTARFSSGGGSCATTSTGIVECQIGDLNVGATVTVEIDVRLDPSGTGDVNNAVSVTSTTPDPVAANNNYSVQTTGTVAADVSVKLALSALSAYAGDTVTYTLTVVNNGPALARNVTFNTVVPPGVTIVRSSPQCTVNACTIAALPPNYPIVLTGTATLAATAASGPGFASTTVISPTYDNNPANDTDTIGFTVLLRADLGVTQTLANPSDPSALVAGQTVTGVVTVVNNGQTRAEGVVLRQAVLAGATVPVVTTTGAVCTFQGNGSPGTITPDGGSFVCNRPTLATSSTWTISFGAVPLPAGYAGPTFARTATVSASTVDPDASNNSVTTTSTVEQHADLRVTKIVTSAASMVQTEEVRFRVTVRNLGPSDATSVVLREDPDTGLSIASGTSADGGYDPNTRAWTLQRLAPTPAADAVLNLVGTALGTGTLNNSTRVVAADGTDPDPADNTDTATVTAVAAAPALDIQSTSTVSTPVPAPVGAVITYSYQVTNTGNLPMTTMTLTGTRSGTASCLATTLAVNASTTCSGAATHTVTSADVVATMPITDTVTAQALNTATVLPATYAQLSTSVSLALPMASLTAVITPTVSNPSRQNAVAAGDRIAYSYAITNNGNVQMDGVTVTDTLGNVVTCPQPDLAINMSMTCGHSPAPGYLVTQADIDTGTPIADVATITATPNGGLVAGTFVVPSGGVQVAAGVPALEVTVTTTTPGPVAVGDTIGYHYEIRNVGNVGVASVAVTDSLAATVTCSPTVIAAGGTLFCHSAATAHLVTQGDVDAGRPVHNDAIVDALSVAPGHQPFSVVGSAGVPVVAAVPDLTVTGSAHVVPAGHAGGVQPGDGIFYTYQVTNAGNVTMQAVGVTDTRTGGGSCPAGPLAPAASVSCASGPTYAVTQDDFDAGTPVSATARASGRAPGQVSTISYGTSTVTVPVGGGLGTLTVAAGPARVVPAGHRAAVEAGDTVAFDVEITNSGNLTMSGLTVTDSRTGTGTCPVASIRPAATITCGTSAYRVTQQDIDLGGPLESSVTVSGRAGSVGATRSFGPVPTWVPVVVGAPSLDGRVIGTADPGGHAAGAVAGDRIGWTYELVNNGNQTMTEVTPSGGVVCPKSTLAVRETMTCAGSSGYTVTQDDVDLGEPIATSVTVAGRAPDGVHTFGPFHGTVAVEAADPALEITMSTQVSSASAARVRATAVAVGVTVGDLLRYAYTVRNRGNVTVGDITVDHARGVAVSCVRTRLAPGASTTCAAGTPYRVTQADVDANVPIADQAYAKGTVPGTGRTVVSTAAGTSVPLAAPNPKVTGAQTAVWADTDGDGRLGPDDTVVSTIRVTNTGNVTLINLRVTGLPAAVVCDATRIAPTAKVTCRSSAYHLTTRQIAAGQHTFEAHIAGDLVDPAAADVTADAPSTVAVPARKPPGKPAVPQRPGDPALPGPGGSVPVTGGASAVLMLLGLSLIIGGAALLTLTRLPTRRRPSQGR